MEIRSVLKIIVISALRALTEEVENTENRGVQLQAHLYPVGRIAHW